MKPEDISAWFDRREWPEGGVIRIRDFATGAVIDEFGLAHKDAAATREGTFVIEVRGPADVRGKRLALDALIVKRGV